MQDDALRLVSHTPGSHKAPIYASVLLLARYCHTQTQAASSLPGCANQALPALPHSAASFKSMPGACCPGSLLMLVAALHAELLG